LPTAVAALPCRRGPSALPSRPCRPAVAALPEAVAALPCRRGPATLLTRPCLKPSRRLPAATAARPTAAIVALPTAAVAALLTTGVAALPDAALTCQRATALPFQLRPYPPPALVWVDDLQLFLQCDFRDGVSLFDLTCVVSVAPAADADSTVRLQWTTRDAAARLAVRSHLPSAQRAHFSQYKTARTLCDAVVVRYSSPATAALSRLMLTDLGEAPRSPPVLYVDSKAMLALCQEHRMEHRTKQIALRYFLA
ncbi:unnamed protein product, partial [Closterium sp. NIES-54]